ncbi:hypothetical protein [Rhodoferax sp.]|uniref:hypothetical protein n=1 Tax=Rhodoferax sp. TaxID=50421 RepID=UPI00285112F3|nr:hypothetical protein [Rhodoferax sp.]MDR3369472.1 hypothetical protein [Rhodoferax sp.]
MTTFTTSKDPHLPSALVRVVSMATVVSMVYVSLKPISDFVDKNCRNTEVIAKQPQALIRKALAAIKTDAYLALTSQVSSAPARLQKPLRCGGWVR